MLVRSAIQLSAAVVDVEGRQILRHQLAEDARLTAGDRAGDHERARAQRLAADVSARRGGVFRVGLFQEVPLLVDDAQPDPFCTLLAHTLRDALHQRIHGPAVADVNRRAVFRPLAPVRAVWATVRRGIHHSLRGCHASIVRLYARPPFVEVLAGPSERSRRLSPRWASGPLRGPVGAVETYGRRLPGRARAARKVLSAEEKRTLVSR